jgi:hypothetical protein
MAVCQNLVPLVNIKIAGKWMFIPLKMVLYNRYWSIPISYYHISFMILWWSRLRENDGAQEPLRRYLGPLGPEPVECIASTNFEIGGVQHIAISPAGVPFTQGPTGKVSPKSWAVSFDSQKETNKKQVEYSEATRCTSVVNHFPWLLAAP